MNALTNKRQAQTVTGAQLQMRTVRTKVYKFSELSKKAQQTALKNYASNAEYFFADDAIESLKEFAKHFNSELKDWSIDFGNNIYSHVRFDTPDEDFTEDELRELIESMGTYNKETLRGDGECIFTGVDSDENAADGARIAFYKKGIRDIEEILQNGYETWFDACVKDYEYQLSLPAYAEHSEINEIEFTKDGEIFNR